MNKKTSNSFFWQNTDSGYCNYTRIWSYHYPSYLRNSCRQVSQYRCPQIDITTGSLIGNWQSPQTCLRRKEFKNLYEYPGILISPFDTLFRLIQSQNNRFSYHGITRINTFEVIYLYYSSEQNMQCTTYVYVVYLLLYSRAKYYTIVVNVFISMHSFNIVKSPFPSALFTERCLPNVVSPNAACTTNHSYRLLTVLLAAMFVGCRVVRYEDLVTNLFNDEIANFGFRYHVV